jgi:lipid A ethanolaminephosphotransferase
MRSLALNFKPSLNSPLTLSWLAALWLGLVCNWPLWLRMLDLPELHNPRGMAFVGAFAVIIVLLLGSLLSLLAWSRLLKPLLALLLLSAAVCAHFIGSYGVVIDPSMIINVLQTDGREAADLLCPQLLLSLLLLAALPLAWLWLRPLEDARWGPRAARNLLSFAIGLLLALAVALALFADLAATMRNHKSLRYMINPLAAVWSIGAAAAQVHAVPQGPPAVVGADARMMQRPPGARPPLILLVVGETARAANFSLNGYSRPTNPELAALPVLSFRQVSSCGTSTAASLPCMFSHLGQRAYGQQKIAQENLLDVLQRAGMAVLWLDNQSGCKGVCARVPQAVAATPAPGSGPLPPGLCDAEECLDEALLHGLEQRLAGLDPERVARGVVLVMHQMGSHGPAYYKRAPAARQPFQPACTSTALQQCPREQVLNAYDNSIAYTDHVLASAIGWLQNQQQRFDPSLLYISDHGESLGENGLYLHGMPYAIAPIEQTHVPLILWFGRATQARMQPDCLDATLDKPLSHDKLFHTMLGLGGVASALYRPGQDLLRACRRS